MNPLLDNLVCGQHKSSWAAPTALSPQAIVVYWVVLLTKIKYRGKILKAAKEKQQINLWGFLYMLSAYFLAETLWDRKKWQDIFSWEREKPKTKITLPSKALIQIWWEKLKALQTSKN